jgi:hypothetical protein
MLNFKNFSTLKALPKIEREGLIVSDEEKAITNAFKSKLPEIPTFLCWRHVIASMVRWIAAHKGKVIDKSIYKNDFIRLLRCTKRDEFDKQYEAIKTDELWDEAFVSYFETFVLPDIDKLGRWTLDLYGLYNLISEMGVTTNISEGTNTSIHQLMPSETGVDQALLIILNWMKAKCNELIRGFCCQGSFPLLEEYRHFQCDPKLVEDELRDCFERDEMIERAREAVRELDPQLTESSGSSFTTSGSHLSISSIGSSINELTDINYSFLTNHFITFYNLARTRRKWRTQALPSRRLPLPSRRLLLSSRRFPLPSRRFPLPSRRLPLPSRRLI